MVDPDPDIMMVDPKDDPNDLSPEQKLQEVCREYCCRSAKLTSLQLEGVVREMFLSGVAEFDDLIHEASQGEHSTICLILKPLGSMWR